MFIGLLIEKDIFGGVKIFKDLKNVRDKYIVEI